MTGRGRAAFRIPDHFRRLVRSARIIGIDTFEQEWDEERFCDAVASLVAANDVQEDVFVRATVHVDALVAGTRSRGLSNVMSIFLYEAAPIVPQDGARLGVSSWRRVPDMAIPSRAKVNGAYVNSVLAKQEALDGGYDDCVFLDMDGRVCESSAANIFMVRDGILITSDTLCDIFEGINRRTMLEMVSCVGIPVLERHIDLTEFFVADEVFLCGTSAFIAPVVEVSKRRIGDGTPGPITSHLRTLHDAGLHGRELLYEPYLTYLA
jgi:branched-chain amino acid aminotransferase